MTSQTIPPPRLAGALFRLFTQGADKVTLAYDLDEYYPDILADKGRFRAELWYWRQVFGSLFELALRAAYWGGIMLKSYLKATLRNIVRQKLHAVINVLGLAVGLTCAILIWVLVRYERSFDRYHENAADIQRVVMKQPGGGHDGGSPLINVTPGPLKDALTKEIPEILRATRVMRKEFLINHQGQLLIENQCFYVDPEFLQIFTFPLTAGDPRTALAEPFSILLTEETARKYFGSEAPVGKIMNVDGKYDFKVTGVIKTPPRNSHFLFDVLASFQTWAGMSNGVAGWSNNGYQTYAQLENGMAPERLRVKLDQIVRSHYRKNSGIEFQLQALTSIHLRSDTKHELGTNGDRRYIAILSAIGLFILLIAGLNYMNLATSRSAVRAREIGIRKVAGADRSHIIHQFLGESLLYILIGFVFSLGLVRLSLPAFAALSGRDLSGGLLFRPGTLGFLALAALLFSLISGSYPAFFLSSIRPIQTLKGSGRNGRPKSLGFRRSLVVAQFSISICLLVCMLVVGRQLHFIRSKNLGFAKDQMVAVALRDPALQKNPEPLREMLDRDDRLKGVSFSADLPITIRANGTADWEGRTADQRLFVYQTTVDDRFLDLYQIKPVLGRGFSAQFSSDPEEACILNQAAAKALGWADPIGKRINRRTVIGVVEDFHFMPLHYEILPLALQVFRAPRMRANYASIRIGGEDVSGALAAIKRTFQNLSPAYPYAAAFLDDKIEAMYQAERTLAKTFNVFSVLALFIACLGLFGLASFTAERRTREIGIRKVLGSSVTGIVILLNREFLSGVAAAGIIAWPVAFLAMKTWIKNFAYRASVSGWMFILATALAVIIALLTVSLQTLKAARANPVDSLKVE